MQFSKFLSLFCATAVCAGFISARADDTPAQAAARAALEQKMQELDAQDASTNSAAPPAVVVTPSGAAQEQPAPPATVTTIPAPAETQPAPVTISPDNDAQATARAALDQKMRELDVQEASTNAPAETQPADTAAQAAARAALDQKMRELDAEQAATNKQTLPMIVITPSNVAPSPLPPANVNYPGKALGLKPIEAPAPPVSADKEAQLQALLAKYMADQVTPEEYQQQRAAILAEP